MSKLHTLCLQILKFLIANKAIHANTTKHKDNRNDSDGDHDAFQLVRNQHAKDGKH